MFTLSILGTIAIIAIFTFICVKLQESTQKKFSYDLFAIKTLAWSSAGALLVFGGGYIALISGDSNLDALVFVFLGIATLIWLMIYNIKHTNLFYGVSGTLLLTTISVFAIVLVIAFSTLLKSGDKNRRDRF